MDAGSAHNPFRLSLASFSNPSSTVSLGAYFRYHQHQPSLTSVWLTWVPSGRSTSARVRLYLSLHDFADHQRLNALVNLRKHLGLFGERHLLGGLDGGETKHTQYMEVVFVESKRSL